MQFPEIHFGGNNPKLHTYNKYYWQPGETRVIEFYPNQNTSVTLLYSSDPDLYNKLATLIDGNPISIDLEWAQPYSHSPHPIELFQFSSSKGTIIVATDRNLGYDQINKFLHASAFFGKGMSSDKKKLRQCCGEDFDYIEDIETARLLPNELPVNFEALCLQFLGHGTAQFKDHKVQRSDWSLRPLTILQILYGGHDSYAMLKVYQKIIEKYGTEIKPYVKKKAEKEKKQAKKKSSGDVKKYRECHFIDLDDYFNKKHITINYDITAGKWFDEQPASLKDLLFKYETNKGVSVKDEDSCFIENANEVLSFLLPTKTKEKKVKVLERICLTADLFLLGIIHKLNDGTFSCQTCDKHLYDPVALIQHSESRHCKEASPNHNLDAKDVLLHYLTALDQVKCPFEIVFDKSQLQNMTISEAECDDETQEEEEEDSQIFKIYQNVIKPRTYQKSDGIKCLICNKDFDSVESLRDHCWLNHYDIFVKLVTGKELEKNKGEDDPQLHEFGLFCINQLHMATVSHENIVIRCGLCKFCISQPSKFFMHAFFKHQEFAIVKKAQYDKWPIRYNAFNDSMIKQVKYVPEVIDYNELAECHLYDKKANKCLDCNQTFKNDQERADHFVEHHLIYFPLELPPME